MDGKCIYVYPPFQSVPACQTPFLLGIFDVQTVPNPCQTRAQTRARDMKLQSSLLNMDSS